MFGKKDARYETKQVTLDISRKKGARELVALQAAGWEIVSEQKHVKWDWKNGQTDYVLKRERLH